MLRTAWLLKRFGEQLFYISTVRTVVESTAAHGHFVREAPKEITPRVAQARQKIYPGTHPQACHVRRVPRRRGEFRQRRLCRTAHPVTSGLRNCMLVLPVYQGVVAFENFLRCVF